MSEPKQRLKTRTLLLLIPLLLLVHIAGACTIFVLTDAHRTLFFNNEDFTNPATRIWFMPGGKDYYGCAYVGFDDGVGQGGINTEGLAFDWYAGKPVSYIPEKDLLPVKGSSSERMLETCATVDDAIEFYKTHAEPGFAKATILIADKTGASVIIGAADGKLYFDRSAQSRALGYGTSIFERMHRPGAPALPGSGTKILRQCFQEGPGGTKYSNVFNLRTGEITMYQFSNDTRSIKFNLLGELQREAHYYDIPQLRRQIAGPPRPLLLNMHRMCLYNLKPLSDQEAAVTARVRKMLSGAARGRLLPEFYSKELWNKLAPDREEIRADLARLGKITSMSLVHKKTNAGFTAYSYIIVFEHARVLMRFTFDAAGQAHEFRSLRGEATG